MPKVKCSECGNLTYQSNHDIMKGYPARCKGCTHKEREHICELCSTPYMTTNRNSKYCSRRCYNKVRNMRCNEANKRRYRKSLAYQGTELSGYLDFRKINMEGGRLPDTYLGF